MNNQSIFDAKIFYHFLFYLIINNNKTEYWSYQVFVPATLLVKFEIACIVRFLMMLAFISYKGEEFCSINNNQYNDKLVLISFRE